MRNKRNRKLMSILLTLSLLVTLLVPMVGPAAAAATYTMSNVTTVTAGDDVGGTIGSLSITGDSTFAVQNKYVYLTLPSDPSGYAMQITVTNSVYANGNLNALQTGDVQVDGQGTVVNGNYRQYKLTITHVSNPGMDASMTVNFNHLVIPSGATGVVTLTASAPSSSTFSNGAIDIAKVNNATVALSVESVPSFGSSGNLSGVIDVKEANKGGLTGSPYLKFKLPPGFSWDNTAGLADHFTPYWGKYYASLAAQTAGGAANQTDVNGSTFKGTVSSDGRTLSIDLNTGVQANPVYSLANGSYWSFAWPINIEDDTVAQQGDIKVEVSGDSSASPSTLVVGQYGEEGVTVKAVGDATTLISGKTDQKLGKFEMDENLKGSFVNNRTITLALPANVKWYGTPNQDADLSTAQGVTVDWTYSGSDAQTLKGTIKNVPNDGTVDTSKIVFKDLEVTPSVDFTGDVNVTVGGSMGLTGTFKLATCNPAVTATTANAPDVKLGLSSQDAADITITEAAAGNLDGTITVSGLREKHAVDAATSGTPQITLKAPAGVTFTTTPTVTVSAGNLQLDTTGITTSTTNANEGLLNIPIKGSSTTASTIKISGIKLTVDRTVPEGALQLKVQGNAIDETTFDSNVDGLNGVDANGNTINAVALYPNSDTAVKVTVANVSTPAPTDQKATAAFKIGDTKFTLNGVEQTMDAAPYLKDDRTYLPIRFVAKAVGVADSNIIWNAEDQSVVLIKGGTVVKLVIGSTTMMINGTPVVMDVAPEIVDPGRTMLPVRWVAQALGCTINWDAATQTVTVN